MADPAPENPMGGILKSLPLEMMFLAPLQAAIQAQVASARATAEYMKSIGFDDKGQVITVRSGYNQVLNDAQGNPTKTVQRVVDAPLLGLIPIPALAIKSVDVNFELTVETSETKSSETSVAGSASGKVGWGFFSASFSASMSSKSSSVRKTDTRARYEVKIHAEQMDPPEGFSRIIDTLMNAMMQPIDADKAPAQAGLPAPAKTP
jgi:hypothetical protein